MRPPCGWRCQRFGGAGMLADRQPGADMLVALGGQADGAIHDRSDPDTVEVDRRGGRVDCQPSISLMGAKRSRPGGGWTVGPAERSFGGLAMGLVIPIRRWQPLPWVARGRRC